MNFDEIAQKAYKHEKLESYCSLVEKYAYERLKNLYEKYKCGDIGKRDAEIEKNCIRKSYEQYKAEYDRDTEVYNKYYNNIIHNDSLVQQIDMCHNKDEMLELALKAVALFISDDYLVERNLAKFK